MKAWESLVGVVGRILKTNSRTIVVVNSLSSMAVHGAMTLHPASVLHPTANYGHYLLSGYHSSFTLVYHHDSATRVVNSHPLTSSNPPWNGQIRTTQLSKDYNAVLCIISSINLCKKPSCFPAVLCNGNHVDIPLRVLAIIGCKMSQT